MPEGKSGVIIALGPPKPKSDEDDEKPSSQSGSLSAAKALMKALKADDAEAVDEALSLHRELSMAEPAADED